MSRFHWNGSISHIDEPKNHKDPKKGEAEEIAAFSHVFVFWYVKINTTDVKKIISV